MTVHVFSGGDGAVVTGTHDILTARNALIVACKSEEVIRVSGLISEVQPTLQWGRVVPADVRQGGGFESFWRAVYGDDINRPGVTEAVVWDGRTA